MDSSTTQKKLYTTPKGVILLSKRGEFTIQKEETTIQKSVLMDSFTTQKEQDTTQKKVLNIS